VFRLEIRRQIAVTDIDAMQYRISDVDAAVPASRTPTVHVPEDVGEAAQFAISTHTPAGLHAAVTGALH